MALQHWLKTVCSNTTTDCVCCMHGHRCNIAKPTCGLQRGSGHRKFWDFRCSEVHSKAFWDTKAVFLATKISTDKRMKCSKVGGLCPPLPPRASFSLETVHDIIIMHWTLKASCNSPKCSYLFLFNSTDCKLYTRMVTSLVPSPLLARVGGAGYVTRWWQLSIQITKFTYIPGPEIKTVTTLIVLSLSG